MCGKMLKSSSYSMMQNIGGKLFGEARSTLHKLEDKISLQNFASYGSYLI